MCEKQEGMGLWICCERGRDDGATPRRYVLNPVPNGLHIDHMHAQHRRNIGDVILFRHRPVPVVLLSKVSHGYRTSHDRYERT
jgi:hypothetical protein